MRLWHVPVRLATGAFILDSGLKKWSANDNEELEKELYATATAAYPQLQEIDSATFRRGLAATEIALGSALLLPVVSPGVAGTALGAFSSGLLGLYLRLPGTRQSGTLRPTSEGLALAKDSWMLAIAAALVLDAAGQRLGRATRRINPARTVARVMG
jgi:hypothetical protein